VRVSHKWLSLRLTHAAILFSVFSGTANIVAPLLSAFLHERKILSRPRFLSVMLLFAASLYVILGSMASMHHVHHGACALKMAFVVLMALTGYCFGSFLTIFPTTVRRRGHCCCGLPCQLFVATREGWACVLLCARSATCTAQPTSGPS
jgi:hypothetical protein